MTVMSAKNLRRALLLAPFGMAFFAASALAQTTLPPRKPGFWQTTMTIQMVMHGQTMGDGTPNVTVMCSDAETDAIEQQKMDGDDGHCEHFTITGGNGSYTMDGSCKDPMGGGTMVTHGTMTMTGDTAAHVESTTTSAQMTGHMVGDSKWIGACPAGVAPGDIGHMDNGNFVKMTNILQQQAPPSPP